MAILTVQSTSGLRSAHPVPSRELLAGCTEVLKTQNVRAIKIGALGSDENAKVIGDLLAIHRELGANVAKVRIGMDDTAPAAAGEP